MKKKFYYAGMLAAGLLTFASCNNDEDPIIDQNPVQTEEDAQVIRIAVANAGDGLTTKAGRPLFSSEAAQTIDKVKVIIVSLTDGSIVGEKIYNNWMSESDLYTDNGHGQEAVWKLSGDDKLTEGKYKVYGVGYHSTSDYTDWTNFDSFVKGGNWNGPLKLTIGNNELGEEVFAGAIAQIAVNADGEFEAVSGSTLTEGGEDDFNVLTLHRQVAGTMGYFTSIPTKAVGSQTATAIENLQLRLVARNLNNKIIFDEFNSDFRTTGDNVWYCVNGWNESSAFTADAHFVKMGNSEIENVNTSANDAHIVYSINLQNWFPNGDANKDGLLDSGDYEADPNNWNTPGSVSGAGFEPGSVFMGKFLIPVKKEDNMSTLQLQLYDTKTGKVLRFWNINLAQDDPQIDPEKAHVTYYTGSDWVRPNDPNEATDEQRDSYSLVRNHLYTIGAKATDDYDPDTDDPEDLSKGQNLILRVNDNWEMIHKMEIE